MTDEQGPKPKADDEQRRRDLWDAMRKELVAQKSSNTEAHDKAVLTLSSVFLGISLAFLKDSAPDHAIGCFALLFASWVCLTLAIITTVISFQLSNRAADVQMVQAERYYRYNDEKAFDRTPISKYVDYVNWSAGILFIFGVFLTVAFVSTNFVASNSMSKISKTGPVHANDGQSISKMQQTGTLERGQSINNMQKVTPASAPAAPPPPPTTTPKK